MVRWKDLFIPFIFESLFNGDHCVLLSSQGFTNYHNPSTLSLHLKKNCIVNFLRLIEYRILLSFLLWGFFNFLFFLVWIGFSKEASTSSLLKRSKTETRLFTMNKRSKIEAHDKDAPNRLRTEDLWDWSRFYFSSSIEVWDENTFNRLKTKSFEGLSITSSLSSTEVSVGHAPNRRLKSMSYLSTLQNKVIRLSIFCHF